MNGGGGGVSFHFIQNKKKGLAWDLINRISTFEVDLIGIFYWICGGFVVDLWWEVGSRHIRIICIFFIVFYYRATSNIS